MVKVKVPWASWREPESREFDFPDSWNISEGRMNNTKEISDEEIRESLINPIGSLQLTRLTQGKKKVVIVIDDMSRPTPIYKIIPHVLKELHNNGILKENITIIGAVGAHRPMNRQDYTLKLGKDIVENYNIQNHHPYENLIQLGKTNKGTPIHVNRTYYEADLKISISGVIPHPLAGYGGGAKIVLPGICGIETLYGNHHRGTIGGKEAGIGKVTETRKDIEDTAKKVGLDFSINIILTECGKIGGVFTGDFIKAHRKAMEFGNQVYMTKVTLDNDVAFFNLYPEDTELTQCSHKCFNFLMTAPNKILKKSGTIVIMASCHEGRGFHSLIGETGAKLYSPVSDQLIWKAFVGQRKVNCFSENLNFFDIEHIYGKSKVFLYNNWNILIEKLIKDYGESLKAIVIPTSIQLAKES